jgi:hypothetical protein
MDVKDLGHVVDKWRRRAATAQTDYRLGTQRPRRSWQQATVAAANRWTQAITEAAGRGAFAAGVQASSDAEWQKGIQQKGVSRWAPGIAASQDKYARNFQPYLETLRSLQLPERGPAGDPANIQRVAVIAEAMRQKKLSLKGGGGGR